MIVRDEILFEIERKDQHTLYLVLVLFIVISALFLAFIGRFDSNPFKLHQEVSNSIQLKLSSNDLLSLFPTEELAVDRWINVQLVESSREKFPIKIKHSGQYTFNFKIDINNTIFNLYKVGAVGKNLYDFFKTAKKWGLETSSPELVQLKVNNVLIGIYIMEEQFYHQLRDETGQYFVRLSSDIILLRRILYQVRSRYLARNIVETDIRRMPTTSDAAAPVAPVDESLLHKHFDTHKMADYFVFFSLFCYNEFLDFGNLVFRYDPYIKKFVPYLTMESVILSLQEQQKTFKRFPTDQPQLYRQLSMANIQPLLLKASYSAYPQLIRQLLGEAKERFETGRSR